MEHDVCATQHPSRPSRLVGVIFCYSMAFGLLVIAPALIIQSMLVAKIAGAEHSTEAFTWPASALLSGVGAGVATGGALLGHFRSPASLGAAAGAALLAAGGAYLLKID